MTTKTIDILVLSDGDTAYPKGHIDKQWPDVDCMFVTQDDVRNGALKGVKARNVMIDRRGGAEYDDLVVAICDAIKV